MDSRSVGIFDSGLGGLTVVKQIVKSLPEENIIYLGDTARVPYGTRSKEAVIRFSLEDAEFLIKKGVKAIVIACNTASSLAFKEVKKAVNVPVFEVIKPASKEAVKRSKTEKIGVIGTRGTINSHAYKDFLTFFDKSVEVFELATPLFVPLIEEGEIKGELITRVAKKYLSFFKDKNIDTLIMGCTHYPIIEPVIGDVVGEKVELINPGVFLASSLKDYFNNNDLKGESGSGVSREYFITDTKGRFSEIAEMFLGEEIKENLKSAVVG